jgi:hypothetical protein
VINLNDVISKIFYNRESKDWGKYKVIEFIEERGKTKIKYYTIKFKNTGNKYEVPLHQIEKNTVIDTIKKKSLTKKINKIKKVEKKQEKKDFKKCVVMKGENVRLLALDISSHSTGYAIFIEGELINYGYLYEPHSKYVTERLNGMKCKIINLIKENHINCVAIEDIINLHVVALHVLSKAQGIILDFLFEDGIDVGIISVKEWKTKYNINRDGKYKGVNSREESKTKTLNCVNMDYNLDLMNEFKNYEKDLKEPPAWDVSDAIAIGTVFLENNIK